MQDIHLLFIARVISWVLTCHVALLVPDVGLRAAVVSS